MDLNLKNQKRKYYFIFSTWLSKLQKESLCTPEIVIGKDDLWNHSFK